MFWAITCEPQKRYSQIPVEPYHVSMAALEPRENIPENRQISLMIEHRGKEFLLCTLEYERVMQVKLDLKFNKGEETFFFIQGDGTVHLSGYLLSKEHDLESELYARQLMEAQLQSQEQYNKEHGSSLSTKRLQCLDDEKEESDDCDFNPGNISSVGYSYRNLRSTSKQLGFDTCEDILEYANDMLPSEEDDADFDEEGDEASSEDADDDDEEVENDEEGDENNVEEIRIDFDEEEVEEVVDYNGEASFQKGKSKKRKKDLLSNEPHPKKIRNLSQSPQQEKPISVKFVEVPSLSKKKKKKVPVDVISDNSNSSSSDDVANSSIGRTPMPKQNFHKTLKDHSEASPSLRDGKMGVASTSKAKQSSVHKTEARKFSNKLASGVEFEDIKIGDGPIAKPGKFAHVHYIGKCNNKVFDSNMNSTPYSFRLGRDEVIKGWDLGIQGMRVNGKRSMRIPPQLAYGKKGNPPIIPPHSSLEFTVHLLAVS